jgi:hypothetical protein
MIVFDLTPHLLVSMTWCTSVVCGGPYLLAKFSAVSLASRVTEAAWEADRTAKSKKIDVSSCFIG